MLALPPLGCVQRKVFQQSANKAPFHTGTRLLLACPPPSACASCSMHRQLPLARSFACPRSLLAARLAPPHLPAPHADVAAALLTWRAVLIDEAGQASEVAALQPLVFGAKRWAPLTPWQPVGSFHSRAAS